MWNNGAHRGMLSGKQRLIYVNDCLYNLSTSKNNSRTQSQSFALRVICDASVKTKSLRNFTFFQRKKKTTRKKFKWLYEGESR